MIIFRKNILYYSVIQSGGNSLCGDVVLDSFNMVYRDEDSIYDQNKNSESFGVITMNILDFKID